MSVDVISQFVVQPLHACPFGSTSRGIWQVCLLLVDVFANPSFAGLTTFIVLRADL